MGGADLGGVGMGSEVVMFIIVHRVRVGRTPVVAGEVEWVSWSGSWFVASGLGAEEGTIPGLLC
jgi:hypothetical protein